VNVFCSLPNGTPHYAAVFFPVLDSFMLTNRREVAPEISEKIGAFGRDLHRFASGFTSHRTPKRKQGDCDFEADFFRGWVWRRKIFPPRRP
jgi:hypothetical protein